MLTLEIKINGMVISLMNMHNEGYTDIPGVVNLSECIYSVEAYIPADNGKPGKLIHAQVIHKREDGALVLVQKAVDQVLKKL